MAFTPQTVGEAMRAIVLPATNDAIDLLDLVARLAFYLAPMQDWTVTIPTSVEEATDLLTPEAEGGGFRVPEGMDPRITNLQRRLAPRIDLLNANDTVAIRQAYGSADMVFVRDRDVIQEEPWASIHSPAAGRRAYPVDPRRDRMEGSQYIQSVFANSPSTPLLVEDCKAKFRQFADQVGERPVAYLLATGPSIERFGDFNFSDGLVVACNTTVLDDELMRHTRPDVLTFADPIFHFGCSRYAAEFRNAVRQAAQEYDFQIVVPLKYYESFTYLEPSLAYRAIGLPFSKREINLDLRSDFEVKVIDNIATFTMLPLAATFARNVGFLGFDGRKPEEDYFWRHNPRTQLNHLMGNIKAVHPGFFDIAYEDYYEQHCENLARYIEHGEARGRRFYTLHPSVIPVLAVRERTPTISVQDLDPILGDSSPEFRVVSLNPDWVDDFGHYGSYDRRLAEAVEELGGDLLSVSNMALRTSSSDLPTVRCFTEDSRNATGSASLGDLHTFESELAGLLGACAAYDGETPTVFAMYVSTPWHLAAFARLRLRFADRPWGFAPNLFLSHQSLLRADLRHEFNEPIDAQVIRLTADARRRLGIDLHADSVRLQRALHRYTGEWPILWPMFSTSFTAEDALAIEQVATGHTPLRVYCPSHAQLAKGYDLLPGLVKGMNTDDRRSWKLVTRTVVRKNTSPGLARIAEELQELTDARPGTMTDEEYVAAFQAAHVIVIPYRFVPFASRTSAVLSDAILLGKPVVATRGTWAGNWVEELGVGTTFADGDVDGMRQAIRLVCRHLDHYREVAAAARKNWAERHSSMQLAEVLRADADRAVSIPADDDLRQTVADMTRDVELLASDIRRRKTSATGDAKREAKPAAGRRRDRGPLLALLRTVRRSKGAAGFARLIYAWLPARTRVRIGNFVRSNSD